MTTGASHSLLLPRTVVGLLGVIAILVILPF
jgi:hypothetical protein